MKLSTFLKAENVYDVFVKQFNTTYANKDYKTKVQQAINGFSWGDSTQGFTFWKELSVKWKAQKLLENDMIDILYQNENTDSDILSQRGKEYGDASESFSKIASMWSTYLSTDIKAEQVAVMMTLMKICRTTTAKGFHLKDSYQDGRIYLTLAEQIIEKKKS